MTGFLYILYWKLQSIIIGNTLHVGTRPHGFGLHLPPKFTKLSKFARGQSCWVLSQPVHHAQPFSSILLFIQDQESSCFVLSIWISTATFCCDCSETLCFASFARIQCCVTGDTEINTDTFCCSLSLCACGRHNCYCSTCNKVNETIKAISFATHFI